MKKIIATLFIILLNNISIAQVESTEQKLDRLNRINKSSFRIMSNLDSINSNIMINNINIALDETNFPKLENLENPTKKDIKRINKWIIKYPNEYYELIYNIIEIQTKYTKRHD